MAITKRVHKLGISYQVKIKGSDGKWITQTFTHQKEAQKFEADLKLRLLGGEPVTSVSGQVTVSEFFEMWMADYQRSVTDGWRDSQRQMFRDYVAPVIGQMKLKNITPLWIARVLNHVVGLGRGPQTRLHVFNVLHKMFADAVEEYQALGFNPVRRKLKPRLPEKERRHLTPHQAIALLKAVDGRSYSLAIWLGLCAGLRVGEIQALKWENVDFEHGLVHIRATYVRKERRFRDYPKGRKWHSVPMTPDLRDRLWAASPRVSSEFVIATARRPFMGYCGFNKALKRYCKEAGVPVISTHELRHSTSGIWKSFGGASNDDMRSLFAHSSSRVTEKYLHGGNEKLERMANVIKLFPEGVQTAGVSQKFPSGGFKKVDGSDGVC